MEGSGLDFGGFWDAQVAPGWPQGFQIPRKIVFKTTAFGRSNLNAKNFDFGTLLPLGMGMGEIWEDLGEIWERFWRGLGIRANKHEFQDGSKTVTGVCHGEEDRKAFDIFV